jgi:hypothetical protein
MVDSAAALPGTGSPVAGEMGGRAKTSLKGQPKAKPGKTASPSSSSREISHAKKPPLSQPTPKARLPKAKGETASLKQPPGGPSYPSAPTLSEERPRKVGSASSTSTTPISGLSGQNLSTPSPILEVISSHSQYLQMKTKFEHKYTSYTSLTKALQNNSQEFSQLGQQLEEATSPEDRKRLSDKITSLYNERITTIKDTKCKLQSLHAELKEMKAALVQFKQTQKNMSWAYTRDFYFYFLSPLHCMIGSTTLSVN